MMHIDADTAYRICGHRTKPERLFWIYIMQDSLLTLPQVCALTSLGRSTVYRHIASGTFPQPIKITFKRSGWRMSDIQNLIKNGMQLPA
jgi:prophage regulatory protein